MPKKLQFVRQHGDGGPDIKFECPNCGVNIHCSFYSSWNGTTYDGERCWNCESKLEVRATLAEE